MIKQIFIAGFVASALAAASASAVPISINSVKGSWTTTVPVSDVTTGSANSGTNNKITWGTPTTQNGSQSGYQFDGVAPPDVTVYEEVSFDLGTFTHFNYPLSASGKPTLSSATLEVATGLTIGTQSHNITSLFNFSHYETPNSVGWLQSCANGESNYGSGVNSNGCADEVSFLFNAGSSSSVSIGNTEYFIDISGFLTGGALTDTFWTRENFANTATLRGIITSQVTDVPEPSTFALLGFGLMVLGLRNRKLKLA